jgi:hypothetical protein
MRFGGGLELLSGGLGRHVQITNWLSSGTLARFWTSRFRVKYDRLDARRWPTSAGRGPVPTNRDASVIKL